MEGKIAKVVEKHLKLLSLEQDAEYNEQQVVMNSLSKRQLQQRGVALYNLRVVEQRIGLGGKTIVELDNPNTPALPAHVMKVGDEVQVEALGKKEEAVQGVIGKITEGSINVMFKDTFPTGFESGLRVLKLANTVVFKRMKHALEKLGKIRINSLLTAIFGDLTIQSNPHSIEDGLSYKFYNQDLNEAQRRAVLFALGRPELALIHGPPGTGKTETLVEIIRQLVNPKTFKDSMARKRVLVCGPSNLSVDNLVTRLAKCKDIDNTMIRIGHPARVLEKVHSHTLDVKLSQSDAALLVKDIKHEIELAIKSLSKSRLNRRDVYSELKSLRRELRDRERGAIDGLINNASIILSTLNMTGGTLLADRSFEVVVIDEAGQALEAECWLAMLLADKVILAGDHCQLPPTITSPEAEEAGLAITLFERSAHKRADLTSLLSIQYRMNKIIMEWSNKEFYYGALMADTSVADHKLSDLPAVISNDDTNAVLVFIDTAGFGFWEAQVDEDQSKYNEEEAKISLQHLTSLVLSGVDPEDIAIITPYNAQVELIKSMLQTEPRFYRVEIGSVDGFQGREKEAVIIPFVRSNDSGEIGFLREVRRTNVAITRARRHICLIGNSETLEPHPFYKRLIDYVEANGEIRFPSAT